jgi:DNA topoisomerase-2
MIYFLLLGSHIKGLFVNFMIQFWPSLLDQDGFLEQFITPIVKAFHGNEVQTFYTTSEYCIKKTKKIKQKSEKLTVKDIWRSQLPEDQLSKWRIKYYKGLGTSSSQEAKEYFKDLERHRITFKVSQPCQYKE